MNRGNAMKIPSWVKPGLWGVVLGAVAWWAYSHLVSAGKRGSRQTAGGQSDANRSRRGSDALLYCALRAAAERGCMVARAQEERERLRPERLHQKGWLGGGIRPKARFRYYIGCCQLLRHQASGSHGTQWRQIDQRKLTRNVGDSFRQGARRWPVLALNALRIRIARLFGEVGRGRVAP